MSTDALPSKIILRMGDGLTPETFIPIAEVKDFDGPSEKNTFHDGTTQEDDSEAPIPSAITRFDASKFTVNFIPSDSTHDHITGMRAALRAKTLKHWQVEYVYDGLVDSFSAYVENFSPKSPVDGIHTADVGLKIASAVTSV